MLIPLVELLADVGPGSALGAFTCYDGGTATGVATAAAELGRPAVLLVPESALRTPVGAHLLPTVLAIAGHSPARLCVQLDHAREPELVAEALELGVGAVLADGSALPDEDNIAYVRQVRDMAGRIGAAVEAELGLVAGDEDRSEPESTGKLTDPESVYEFARRSGCDLLAISIGNRHGASRSRPALDWGRLSAIAARAPVPLAMHGGTGIADEDVSRLIVSGVRKINVNTEIRAAQIAELRVLLPVIVSGDQTLVLHSALVQAACETARSKLERFSRKDCHVADQTG